MKCPRCQHENRVAAKFCEECATPLQAPNANAYAERFVRSMREECLDRVIPFGERRLRHVIDEFVAHYHRERNHQGLGNELIAPQDD